MIDAELALVALLRTAMPSVSFFQERPSDPETWIPFVVVQQLPGSATTGGVWDALSAPLMAFEAWGVGDSARQDALTLGRSVRAALHTIARDQASGVTPYGALNRVQDVSLPAVVPSLVEGELARLATYQAITYLRPGA